MENMNITMVASPSSPLSSPLSPSPAHSASASSAPSPIPLPSSPSDAAESEIGGTIPKNKLKKPIKGKRNVVLVACGSFSPITYLHLRLFEQGRDWIKWNQVGWEVLGGYISPVTDAYAKRGLATGFHRTKMCQIACESSDWVMVSDWEVTQKHYQRTVTVLSYFATELNKGLEDQDLKIYPILLCGADLVQSLTRVPDVWAEDDVKAILNDYGALCINRDSTNLKDLVYDNELLYSLQKSIWMVPQFINNDVSSSRIRQALSRGLSVKYLIPDPVIDYIKQHRLFHIPQSRL